MNAQEITACLATPHLTPNWYRYDGKILTLITRTDRLKYLNLHRDPRISVRIDDPPVASHYVVISGTAACSDQDIWDEARRILTRSRAAWPLRAPAAVR